MPKIFHEIQQFQFCGIHAINNLLGYTQCNKSDLDQIASELAPTAWLNPHRSIFGIGNYDVNVLIIYLQNQGFEVVYFDRRNDISSIDLTNPFLVGFICNVIGRSILGTVLSRHWLSIRKHESSFINVDSKLKSPITYTKFQLQEFLKSQLDDPQFTVLIVTKITNQ